MVTTCILLQRMDLCNRKRRLPRVEEPFIAAEKRQHVEMSCILAVG